MTRLELYRRSRNLTQQDLADLVGVSTGTIVRFERWGEMVFKTIKGSVSRPRANTVTLMTRHFGDDWKKMLENVDVVI